MEVTATPVPEERINWWGVTGYVLLIVCAVGAYFLVRHLGRDLTAPTRVAAPTALSAAKAGQVDVVLHVLATLVAVITLGTLLGWVFRKCGQPPVIGEILAGILLGPSLLGAIAPEMMQALIPSRAADPNGKVSAALTAVSQLGVVLYMFLVGLELNASRLKSEITTAVAVSHASIVIPFILGLFLALGLYSTFSHADVPFTSFALFLGSALAITAFPVLARILSDRKLDRSDLGIVALGCAAADDVTAWCLLALVVGVAQADVTAAFGVVVGAVAFILTMFLLVKPVVNRFNRHVDGITGPLPPLVITGMFLAVLLASLTTELIGVHAVFGAFLLGVVIPHDGRIADEFTLKLKDPVMVLFLPAFFAYTGMRTQIGLLTEWHDWFWTAIIIAVATLGKVGGTLCAGRLTGQTWQSAAALGVLMNTRGLMGLVVLNIGLDMGVISPRLFAMMVVMALVTTAATVPLLNLILGPHGDHHLHNGPTSSASVYTSELVGNRRTSPKL